MSTMYRYQLPVEQTGWKLNGETEATFSWEYEDGREKLLALYDKGKKQQWDAATRIDWSQDLDPENPMMLDDRAVQIWGSPVWERLTDKERVRVRHHLQAQTLSQFMHGEQGALMAAARIVQMVPDLDAKFYAATQVMDEARHVEAYARLLNEKLGIAYPITPGLKSLLETTLTDLGLV
jgi:ribonucleotide reductase beta subunit family protein with ferritin-like domain